MSRNSYGFNEKKPHRSYSEAAVGTLAPVESLSQISPDGISFEFKLAAALAVVEKGGLAAFGYTVDGPIPRQEHGSQPERRSGESQASVDEWLGKHCSTQSADSTPVPSQQPPSQLASSQFQPSQSQNRRFSQSQQPSSTGSQSTSISSQFPPSQNRCMSQLSSSSALSTPLSSQYLSSQNRPFSQLSSSAGSAFSTPLSSQGLSSQVSQSKPTPTSRHVATPEWTPECTESSQATQKRCATPFRPSFQPMSGRSTDRPTKAVRNLKREWQLEKKEDIVAQAARDSGIPIKKASSNASIALPPPKSRKPSVNQLGQSQHISSLESNHQQGLANSTCDTTATLAETLPPTDKANQQCLATSTSAMGDSLSETVPPTHRSNKDQQGSVYSTGVMGDFLPDTVPRTGVSDINVQQHDLDTSNSIKPSLQHMENPPPVPTKDDRNTKQVDAATTSSNNESPRLISTPPPSKKSNNNEKQLDTTTTSTINASPQLMKTPPPPIKQASVFDLTGHTRPKTPAMRKEMIKKLNESVCNKTMDESMACLTGVDWDVASQVVLNGKRAAKTVEYWQKHMEEQMKWLRIIHDGPCDRTRVVGFVMQSWQMMTSVFATFVPRPPEIQMVVERYASNCIKFYELFTLRGYEELSSVMMDFTQRVLARFLSAPVHMNELSHSWVYTRQVLRMMCQHPTNIDILLTLTATLDEIKMKFITTWSLGPTAPLDRNMEFITYSLQELVNLIVMANDRIQQLQRMDMHSIKC